jgi:predicted N-acetyltransferase YhbS
MEVTEFGLLTDKLRHEVEGNEPDPFDSAGARLSYRPKERHVGLRDEEGSLVACTGMLVLEVEAGGQRFPVVGIGGVIVAARFRGRGLAREVVGLALDRARALGPDHALLFCREDRRGLYVKLGFADVADEVLVQQPTGYEPMELLTMWKALHDGRPWPAGQLVVDSLPF